MSHTVLQENSGISKNKGTSLRSGALSQTLRVVDFSAFWPLYVDRRKRCQLSSTVADFTLSVHLYRTASGVCDS